MLAKAFESFHKRTYNYIIFASGVSNSNETSFENFNREKELLLEVLEQYKDKTIVYFSSCSIYDSSLTNSLYVYHKMCMERLVRENSKKLFNC
ncbi:naD-dependent epimerase/dehydratase [Aggregatibacter actinomycetemcomitans ANH9381]|nr:naD-dependent epimerase/dehydratase [Aggregatibacter actinomycetemcomitans ANH9381]